jgi:hypothetical protein
MSFQNEPSVSEVTLNEVDSSGDPAFAIMSDGSRIEFPKGLKFTADNFRDNGKVHQLRLRITQPLVDGKPKGPSILLPKGVNKEYLLKVLERLELGV